MVWQPGRPRAAAMLHLACSKPDGAALYAHLAAPLCRLLPPLLPPFKFLLQELHTPCARRCHRAAGEGAHLGGGAHAARHSGMMRCAVPCRAVSCYAAPCCAHRSCLPTHGAQLLLGQPCSQAAGMSRPYSLISLLCSQLTQPCATLPPCRRSRRAALSCRTTPRCASC